MKEKFCPLTPFFLRFTSPKLLILEENFVAKESSESRTTVIQVSWVFHGETFTPPHIQTQTPRRTTCDAYNFHPKSREPHLHKLLSSFPWKLSFKMYGMGGWTSYEKSKNIYNSCVKFPALWIAFLFALTPSKGFSQKNSNKKKVANQKIMTSSSAALQNPFLPGNGEKDHSPVLLENKQRGRNMKWALFSFSHRYPNMRNDAKD